MTHRQIMEALTGLLAAFFTAILSSTIVANALPTIMSELKGTQTDFAWVITAALLANAATTPIWGKLADLFDKKLLVQLEHRDLRGRLGHGRPVRDHPAAADRPRHPGRRPWAASPPWPRPSSAP